MWKHVLNLLIDLRIVLSNLIVLKHRDPPFRNSNPSPGIGVL